MLKRNDICRCSKAIIRQIHTPWAFGTCSPAGDLKGFDIYDEQARQGRQSACLHFTPPALTQEIVPADCFYCVCWNTDPASRGSRNESNPLAGQAFQRLPHLVGGYRKLHGDGDGMCLTEIGELLRMIRQVENHQFYIGLLLQNRHQGFKV